MAAVNPAEDSVWHLTGHIWRTANSDKTNWILRNRDRTLGFLGAVS